MLPTVFQLHQETDGNGEGARKVGSRERAGWRGRAAFVAGGVCYRTWESVPFSVNFVDFQKPLERVGEFGTMKVCVNLHHEPSNPCANPSHIYLPEGDSEAQLADDPT